jgi:peptidoglycan/xylan/chitin deacetylase (PgdA/CDA1 family)
MARTLGEKLGMREPAFKVLRLEGVPVFVYHGMLEDGEYHGPAREKKYWVIRAQFREHLSHIRSAGFSAKLLKDLWDPSVATNGSKSKVILTFDDGLASDYRVAFPVLQEAGAPAEFFLNTSTIGKKGYLSWQQIEEMQKWGMSFQSHGHDHVDFTRLSKSALDRQLRISKSQLEDRLARSVDFFAAPYGRNNEGLVRSTQEAGYRAVCTCRSWPARAGRSVDRTVLFRHTTSSEFQQLLKCNALAYLGRVARKPLYLPGWLLLHISPGRVGIRILEEQ